MIVQRFYDARSHSRHYGAHPTSLSATTLAHSHSQHSTNPRQCARARSDYNLSRSELCASATALPISTPTTLLSIMADHSGSAGADLWTAASAPVSFLLQCAHLRDAEMKSILIELDSIVRVYASLSETKLTVPVSRTPKHWIAIDFVGSHT